MSADISTTRGVSAAETSEALSAADGLDLSIDGSYVAAGVLSPPAYGRVRPGDRSRQGSDLLHHRFGVSLGRNGGEHEVSPGRRAYAIPEVRAGDDAPAAGWLA